MGRKKLAKLNRFITQLSNWVIDLGAKQVRNVENTISPLGDVSTPIDTVSLSHNSLTVMMSGSAHKKSRAKSSTSMLAFL